MSYSQFCREVCISQYTLYLFTDLDCSMADLLMHHQITNAASISGYVKHCPWALYRILATWSYELSVWWIIMLYLLCAVVSA